VQSYEDDIGEGPLAGMHRTDEKGRFKEWTPRPERFREREYSRVKVGVPDADGMDSWEEWRKAHLDRPGHGNIALQPYKLPTTDESVVFRGPLKQPREVAPVDQNYDFTDINRPLSDEGSQAGGSVAAGRRNEATPVEQPFVEAPRAIVRDGIEYIPVPAQVQPATVPVAQPVAVSAGGQPVAMKDENLLKALHDVVEGMHSSEADYAALKRQLGVLEASRDAIRSRAAASKDRLQAFAREEQRILGALEGKDCDPCQKDAVSMAPEPANLPEDIVAEEPAVADETAPQEEVEEAPAEQPSEEQQPAAEEVPAETEDAAAEQEGSAQAPIVVEPEEAPHEAAENTAPAETQSDDSGSEEKPEQVVDDVESSIGGAVNNVAGIFEGEPRPTVQDAPGDSQEETTPSASPPATAEEVPAETEDAPAAPADVES